MTASEINFAAWPIMRSTSRGVTIARAASGSILPRSWPVNWAARVAPSMTVGTPTEMTGTPRVRSLSSLRLFCTPEPGEMPVLAIWMVEPRRL